MRIAYVYDAVYPYILGGVEKRVWEIARRLVARGHDVHLFGMHLWDGESTITRDGVVLHGICRPYGLYRKGKRRILPAFLFGIMLLPALARERFDVVDCQQFPYTSVFGAAAACRIARSPFVITWHEVWGEYWYEYLGSKGSAGKVLERLAARIRAGTIAVSDTTRDGLTSLIGDREVTIIPNGIDLAAIDAILPAEEKSDVLFVGRLIREKHVDVLVDAIGILRHRIPGIRCLVIGDGPERMDLEEKVRTMNLSGNIQFTGFFKRSEDMIARMKSSRVFVLPSTREGFGISALEALAAGLPVVTVDHPKNASRVFTLDGCGLLSSLDAADLSEKIQATLSRDEVSKLLCRTMSRDYEWEAITDMIEKYYVQVRSTSGNKRPDSLGEKGSGYHRV
ncbi:MAG: glycosyltransferase family 4 protein [Methanoregulaceae archaeon]|jgi:glycosyltransferase involved in cell wall biosynthesis